MTDEEFAQRRAQIQEECRRGIELIEAVCREQLHALELLRRSGGPVPAWEAAVPAAGAAPVSPPASGPLPAAPAPVRRSAGDTDRDIRQALSRLPEEFTTPELLRVLGYSPHRGTLHRLLGELAAEGALRRESRGEGKRLSRYRRLSPAPPEAAGGPPEASTERGTPAPEPGAAAGPGEAKPDGAG